MKFIFVILMAMVITACDEGTAHQQAKITQAKKAKAAADSISFTENAEIDNIKKRLELTANPGLLGYVVLLNEMGQPVMYTGVKGKITSGGKRLTPTEVYGRVPDADGKGDTCCYVSKSPSDEGTYGSSGEYVYFWTPAGQYIQWNGKFLYSDKPFRLTTEPLVLAVK